MLSDKQITKFQLLYKNCFGKEISRDEAQRQGITLVRLMQLVYKPIKLSDFKKLQNNKQKDKK